MANFEAIGDATWDCGCSVSVGGRDVVPHRADSDTSGVVPKRMKIDPLASTNKPMTKTKENRSPALDEVVEDPFGLKEKAKKWLEEEMAYHSKEGYLVEAGAYHPQIISKGKKISALQHKKAAEEYEKRMSAKKSCGAVRPVLVALGVAKDSTFKDFLDDHTGPIKSASYLYLPYLSWEEEDVGALFITYMPGPVHGAIDAVFHGDAQNWRKTAHRALRSIIATGCSSGAHNAVQPDFRVMPNPNNKDRNGNDVDRAHKDVPHTRLYWEIECDHRKIVDLRRHGAFLMGRTEHARFFVGATISKPDPNDRSFEAAMVLWGKNESNEVSVLQAVSFGTKDLSDETKKQCKTQHSVNQALPAVQDAAWRGPPDAGALPEMMPDPTPAAWLLCVPTSGLLYKVMIRQPAQEGQQEDRWAYFLDTLGDNVVVKDVEIDLMEMALAIKNLVEGSGIA